MNKIAKNAFYLFTSCFIWLWLCTNSFAVLIDPSSSPKKIAAPLSTHRLLYILSADHAILIKKNAFDYYLILHDPHPKVNFKFAGRKKESGTELTGKFIKTWLQCARHKKVSADITGTQINNKTMGHSQFYTTSLISDPVYDAKKNRMKFNLISSQPNIITEKKSRFDNTTLFINGCHIYKCRQKC